MRRESSRSFALVFSCAVGLLGVLSCADRKANRAVAKEIVSRADLIGGPGALGDVGDYLLANDQIRVIVQGGTYSRGFGVYAGALIDADLVRPRGAGDGPTEAGLDRFGEMFPAFFMRVMKPSRFEARQNEDGSASVVVSGDPGEFGFMLRAINETFVGVKDLAFENEYRIYPRRPYIEIITSILNTGSASIRFPESVLKALPMGDVLLFGAKNKVFSPGPGFDLRFTLEELYSHPVSLPKLPGIVTPFLATRGNGVSYGFASGVTDPAHSFLSQAGYEGVRPDDLLVPFIFSAFTGTYYFAPPAVSIPSRGRLSFKKYFIVGRGDVSSIRDAVHEIREYSTGLVTGQVIDATTGAPDPDVSVVTFDAKGNAYSQHTPDHLGNFRGTYEAGKYTYRIVSEGRFTTLPVAFDVQASKTTPLHIALDAPGQIALRITAEDGRPLPGKCTFVSNYPAAAKGTDPKRFLYNLKVGEHMRPTDLLPDTDDPATREYIEAVVHVGPRPVTARVRPGTYKVVCSRGIEYELSTHVVEVRSPEVVALDVVLKQSMATPGWASGDYHLHSENSLDSAMNLDDRVLSAAAEGVDIALSSDHNFVTDLRPSIATNGLSEFIQGMVGIELTTIEIGHFNGFPLRYDAGPATKGSFAWSGRPPSALFQDLRDRGAYGPEQTVVQINHPRETILGYFNDYEFDQDSGEAEALDDPGSVSLKPAGPEFGRSKFDLTFDAIEIFNGKRTELIRNFRVPAVLPPPPLPPKIDPPGTIVRDEDGKIAFPGGMDDWFVFLDQGRKYTATGNSDSHDEEEEVGYPRTYIPVSNDHPGEIDELEIVWAMKHQAAVVTNGPLLALSVNGMGMGETARADATKTVQVHAAARSASWIDLAEVSLVLNGTVAKSWTGTREALNQLRVDLVVPRDSWVVLEAHGRRSLWPVVRPFEVPPIQVNDVVGSLASSFGLGNAFGQWGNLVPDRVHSVLPYAFTNPVYIDADGDGKYTGPRERVKGLRVERVRGVPLPRPSARELPTLARMFALFACHND